MSEISLSKSRALASKVIFASLNILKEKGGELSGREVIEEVERKVNLDEWAKERYEKTGYIRWQSILHFYTIDCIKAGFLVKKKGIWFLTPEGEEALNLGDIGLLNEATKRYKEWKLKKDLATDQNPLEEQTNGTSEREQELAIDEIEQLALDGIRKAINAKNPYEFQDLAAALLRAMGYFTPFVAPRGKDGGIDIVAYRDPLGTQAPRIKIQIKHRESSTSVQDIRQLMGVLQKDGDVGIFFSTGGFTPDAKATARSSHVHVELIDLERFINLWQEFYEKLTDEDKAMLPLLPIYFIAPSS
ncbi:MAG TPA: restriction endonuclease [Pyrinomonadaceae bacterium]|jgi:restriction system protein